ncbi:hypothetical protein [Nitrospirillum amazonense]|nr:hypothetical protein [Nitrospirillum amazonense]MDG3441464.1 hypothetical protein [Nitrospirillum amazonense]
MAGAVEWTWSDIDAGLASSFDLPFSREKRTPLEGLTLGTGVTVPMTRSEQSGPTGSGQQGAHVTGSPTVDALIRYEPLPGWFAMTDFHRYVQGSRQAPWNPDFDYGFGFDNGAPFSLHLTYFNYASNRLDPSAEKGENVTRFNQGTWSAGWRFPVPEALATPMLLDPDLAIDCTVDVNVSPRFYDQASAANRSWKQSLSLGCHYPVVAGIYVEWKAFAYPQHRDQQPWDPDFTYAVGWSWGYPGTFSLRYGNYSGNRWPGRDAGPAQGRFVDGAITASWSQAW